MKTTFQYRITYMDEIMKFDYNSQNMNTTLRIRTPTHTSTYTCIHVCREKSIFLKNKDENKTHTHTHETNKNKINFDIFENFARKKNLFSLSISYNFLKFISTGYSGWAGRTARDKYC